MLTEVQMRGAFLATNTAEPLSEGWPGLERFGRKIEEMVKDEYGIEVPVNEAVAYSDDILSERCWKEKRIADLIMFLSKAIASNSLVFEKYQCYFDQLRRLLHEVMYITDP